MSSTCFRRLPVKHAVSLLMFCCRVLVILRFLFPNSFQVLLVFCCRVLVVLCFLLSSSSCVLVSSQVAHCLNIFCVTFPESRSKTTRVCTIFVLVHGFSWSKCL